MPLNRREARAGRSWPPPIDGSGCAALAVAYHELATGVTMTLVSRDTVLDELATVVAQTLRLDRAVVRPDSSLVADLGAASLDLLDVNYRLEQVFGLRMARHLFLEHAEELAGEGSVVDERGVLTARGVELLGERAGAAAVDAAGGDLGLDQVAALITVQAMADAVADILATRPAVCSCGSGDWTSADGRRVTCGACGEAARYVDGDELIRRWLAPRLRVAPASATP